MTKLVTAPMACGAVMVPTSMFMGQVVTAYNPFSGQQVGTKQHRRIVLWFMIGVVRSVCMLVLTLDKSAKKTNKNHVQGLDHLPVGPFWFS